MRRTQLWQVIVFVAMTFLLSWGFDLTLTAASGGTSYPELGMTPWGMLAPAFAALVLRLFLFHDSPIRFRTLSTGVRWIFLSYLLLAVAYGVVTILAAALPAAQVALQGIGAVLLTAWTMAILFLGGQSDPQARERAGLNLGNVRYGQRFILGAVAFFLSQAGLNLLFGLGDWQGKKAAIYGLPVPPAWYLPTLVLLFVGVTVIGTPLSGLAAVFGEEYGWRGHLRGALDPLGKVRSALLVGLVWGVWHVPVILRGAHTYPPTWLGVLLGMVFFVLWGLVQSYAVLKTGGIWVPAFMHGVVNSVYAFTLNYVARPRDTVLSFGLGVYGLACLAVLVGAIMRDRVWRGVSEPRVASTAAQD
jgi:membrane protease YdiL (CAAX protease family)